MQINGVECDIMKYIANVITSSRILFAVLIVLCEPFSVFFGCVISVVDSRT